MYEIDGEVDDRQIIDDDRRQMQIDKDIDGRQMDRQRWIDNRQKDRYIDLACKTSGECELPSDTSRSRHYYQL